ncbi:unnamed protein product [Schistosoma margrebowiei]|uniref:LINES_N domain-containing protein n=1 Tax=Schistosoma margrebowiei TaxID=48269 RepID=A0AA84ZZV2_9TREM|nr:unnamed protein product [Schistosoma margrebowiei]
MLEIEFKMKDFFENNQLDIVYQLSQHIQSLTINLLRTDFNKIINSNDDNNNLIDIPSLFSNDQLIILLEYLRTLRQWAATIPNLLNNNNNNNDSIDNINHCRQDVYNSMKYLLDSLFLYLFHNNQLNSLWYKISIKIQSNIILCISICIQIIINLLSESIQSIKLFNIHSLLIILLSNNRPFICLTNYHSILCNHYDNYNRLSSHYAYLLYLLLLRIEQTINDYNKLPKLIIQLLQINFIHNKTIIKSILEQSCNTIQSNNNNNNDNDNNNNNDDDNNNNNNDNNNNNNNNNDDDNNNNNNDNNNHNNNNNNNNNDNNSNNVNNSNSNNNDNNNNNNNDPTKMIHYQLLLIQLMKSFNQFIKLLSFNEIIIPMNIDFIYLIIDITGFVLLLLNQYELINYNELSMKPQRILPMNIKLCLGYWLSYRSMLHASSSRLINDTMDILLNECSRLSSLWIKELIVCSPEKDSTIQANNDNNNNNTVSLLHVNYPYARLRGLVHILASITFSNLDNSNNSNLNTDESISTNSEGIDHDKQPVDIQSSSSSILSFHQESNESSEQNMPITQEYATELLKILCNILVITHYATHKFEEFYDLPDSIKDNLPFKNDLVKDFTVYPSKLAKKMVLLSTRSPFSLIQAICFKQDVIRCIVGLITQFPELSLTLVLHKFDANNYMIGDGDDVSEKLINSTTPTPSFLSAFEVILDATNRDPFNSFCVEWSILLIRLIVKSNHAHSSQVISIVSSKLKGLNILND